MDNFPTTNKKLIDWVNKASKLCGPEKIIWIDGSEEQKKTLEKECVASGELLRLNKKSFQAFCIARA
jgi:phosphoenolpyruvate carboxykinase (GTP)